MEKDVYELARKRVKKKKGFYGHLSSFIAVTIFFFIMNIATWDDSGEWWFFFPVLPWSIGLIIHYFSVFGLPGTDVMTRDWEEREIEKEAKKIRGYSKHMPDYDDEDGLELKELRRAKNEPWADEDLV